MTETHFFEGLAAPNAITSIGDRPARLNHHAIIAAAQGCSQMSRRWEFPLKRFPKTQATRMQSKKKPVCRQLSLGRLLATPGALDAIESSGQTPGDFLARHLQHDWGCVSADDQRLNNTALRDGSRILSAYETRQGVRLWIITEAADEAGNRPSTTILLPQEY